MKISIIIASYNYAKYLQEAIDSVINQSYKNWELIIVDDGSSDNSLEIIEFYCEKDRRIKLFCHENGENKGLKETILLGLKNVTGDWVAFLESDDTLQAENLAKKVEIIKEGKKAGRQEVKLIFNKAELLYEGEKNKFQARIFEKNQKKLSQMKFPKNMFYDLFIDNLLLTFSCVMVEAQTIANADFSTPKDAVLDWWLWVHLAFENDFYYVDEELTSWRLHDKSYIKSGKSVFPTQILAYIDVFRKNPNIKLLVFIIYSFVKLFFVKCFRFFSKIVGRFLRNTL